MSATEKTISSLVKSQLPDFVKAEHPKFQRFMELYYEWLEQNSANGISNTAGNTVYHAMNIEDYRNIDETPDEFLRYFKEELLPSFPENTALSTQKILKAAREFYNKKGSLESIRWLFRVLYGEDIEVNYPKEQILIASDGKWIKPKAFRITVNDANRGVNVQLFKKRLVTGVDSGATCVVESADRTIDPVNGTEILEIYISNIKKYFNNGEYIEINYVDENGVAKTFRDRIIGTISNIKVDSNIKTDPQQSRRGLYYNVGDPIVIVGGLGYTLEANDAAAIVGNVTPGSIEAVNVNFPGYGYREYYDTETIVLATYPGDYPGANSNTDLRVSVLNVTACTSNSQRNFIEPITYDKTVIDYLADTVIGNANLSAFTVNNHNAIINVTENDEDDEYYVNEEIWANGTNFVDAKFTAKVGTPNNVIFGVGGPSANTGGLLVYDIEVKNGLTLTQALTGSQLYTKNTAKSFAFNSVTTDYLPANANSTLLQCLNFDTVNTGGLALISVLNGGYGFRFTPSLQIQSHYDTHLSEQYSYTLDKTLKKTYWQTFKDLGQIAHVYINSGGSGYSVNDVITFNGRGYGGNAYVQTVNGTGAITSVVLSDRGEGYLERPNVDITSAGSGASLTAYLFGDGATETVYTSAIGRVRDIRLIYRGYDYVAAPNVYMKVMDAIINPIDDGDNVFETEYIFQGTNLSTSTFKANVKSLNRTTNNLRLYNQSGTLNPALDLITANGVYMNLNVAANVTAPTQYPSEVRATGLPNPMIYGNGLAKANALFANGLIEFNGFYLNTDGFVSADKVLQDGDVYHNFSYMIQSEKSLAEFETPVKNIIHPAGLALISKTISKAEEEKTITLNSNVNVIMPGNGTSGVNVANSFGNTVTGFNTLFLPDTGDIEYSNTAVNVGDLFIINDGLRAPVSRVVDNVVSNNEITIKGDFIYRGDGKLQSNVYYLQITGNAAITTAQNTIVGTDTLFTVQLAANNLVKINNEVKRIVSVTNNIHAIVNSNFTYSNTESRILKFANTRFVLTQNTLPLSNIVQTGDRVWMNIDNTIYYSNVVNAFSVYIDVDYAIESNVKNLVYLVQPDFGGNATVSGTVNVTGNVVSTNTANANTPLSISGTVYPGSTVTINSEIKMVESISNGTEFVVNSAFNNNVTDGRMVVNKVFSYKVVTLNIE